jgi:hypothetical protein
VPVQLALVQLVQREQQVRLVLEGAVGSTLEEGASCRAVDNQEAWRGNLEASSLAADSQEA